MLRRKSENPLPREKGNRVSIPSRFESDLKLLTRAALTEKYGEHDWDEYLLRLAAGVKLTPLTPLADTAVLADEPEELPEAEPAAPPYRGRAFGRFVMIRRLEAEHSGRLVMPSRIAGTSDLGWVASTGEECKHIRPGQIVLFDQYASVGREVRVVDENGLPGNFLIVEEPDILAILEKV